MFKKPSTYIIIFLLVALFAAVGFIVVDQFGGVDAIKANIAERFNMNGEEEIGRGGPSVAANDEEECLGAGCGPEKVLPVIPVSDPKQDGLDLYRFAAMGKTIDEGVQALINLYNPNNGSVDCKNGCTLNLAQGKIVAAWTDWCGGPAPEGAVELLPGSTDGGYGLWLLKGGHKYELLKGGYHPALPAGYDTFDFGSVDMSRLIGANPQQAVDIVIGFFNEIEGSKNCANGCTITVRQGERWLVGTDWLGAPPKGAIAAVPTSQSYGYGAFQLLPGTYTLKNGVAVPLGK